MQRKSILFIIIVALAGFPTGCAYFNTFYNAEQYFQTAEQARLEKTDEKLSTTAKDAYEKVINKSRIILDKYPDSKYADSARLLIGISQFHLEEYSSSEEMFHQLLQEGDSSFNDEAIYWLAMCKWKEKLPQPALDDLLELTEQDISETLLSTIYLSISEIYLELEDSQNALKMLEKAALLVSSSSKKSQIYYRLSNLAEDKEDWEKAIYANRQVIKHSLSTNRIMEAHLKIIRIYRISGQIELAFKKASKLLKDDDFQNIQGDIQLEIGKLLQLAGEVEEALAIFSELPIDYPKSLASAEGRYLLGEYALNHQWNLPQAKLEYVEVSKESRQSPFSSIANERIKNIDELLSARKSIFELSGKPDTTAHLDSLGVDTVIVDSIALVENCEILAAHHFKIAELENFQFEKPNLALIELDTILSYPKSISLYPKALYLKAHIHKTTGDIQKSEEIENEIISTWPLSEYASNLLASRGIVPEKTSSEKLLTTAEQLWSEFPDSSIVLIKELLKADSTSTFSASALYFLAFHYDMTYYNPDSALKYYQSLVETYPESEQALKSKNRFALLKSTFLEINADTVRTLPDSIQVFDSVDSLTIITEEENENPLNPIELVEPDSIIIPKSSIDIENQKDDKKDK